MTVPQPKVADTCPRCGSSFHCGAAEPAPCACAGVGLSAELRHLLALRYRGCLCRACLEVLAQGAPLERRAEGP